MKTCESTPLAGQELGVSRFLDGHSSSHLANDQLDVLVMDRNALVSVYPLHLVHEVLLGFPHPRGSPTAPWGREEPSAWATESPAATSWPSTTASFQAGSMTMDHSAPSSPTHRQPAGLTVLFADADHAGNPGELGLALGSAGLEQLHYPGQAAGDVLAGHTARCGRYA